jgi:hypothetical protein
MNRLFTAILVLVSASLTWVAGCSSLPGDNVPTGYRLVYSQSFDNDKAIDDFLFTNSDKWLLNKSDENSPTLEFLGPGEYQPKVRSPYIIGLLGNYMFGDFILEADMLQTGKDYGHRDMCLFFGFRDPSHFYYVHLATKADPNAHNIFIVNDKPRIAIAKKTTDGIDWGRDLWHKVRLERDTRDGTIKVYYDEMTSPIMVGQDKTFGLGYVGFGSFDDSGQIDNIKIWAPDSVEKKATFF